MCIKIKVHNNEKRVLLFYTVCTELCCCGAEDESNDNVMETESVDEDPLTGDMLQILMIHVNG